ncbi:MAG: hypothetical protein ACI32C_05735 [Candidatus Enteromonas sp.]
MKRTQWIATAFFFIAYPTVPVPSCAKERRPQYYRVGETWNFRINGDQTYRIHYEMCTKQGFTLLFEKQFDEESSRLFFQCEMYPPPAYCDGIPMEWIDQAANAIFPHHFVAPDVKKVSRFYFEFWASRESSDVELRLEISGFHVIDKTDGKEKDAIKILYRTFND